MKTIGITMALTTCLTAACLDSRHEEKLQEEPIAHLEEIPQGTCYSRVEPEGLVVPARTEEKWRLLMASDDSSRVRSLEDWNRCLLDSTCNPLAGVDPAAVDAFTRALVFRNGGLAGARFDMVENLLSYAELMQLWDTFGIGRTLFATWVGARCGPDETPGTPTAHYLRTSNC